MASGEGRLKGKNSLEGSQILGAFLKTKGAFLKMLGAFAEIPAAISGESNGKKTGSAQPSPEAVVNKQVTTQVKE